MQLTSFTDYAIRTLIFLTQIEDQALTNISNVSESFQISKNHLIKVVHKLGQLGYIETVRGKNGGIRLAKAASEINIGELIIQIEPLDILDCSEHNCHITNACRLKSYIHKAKLAFLAELKHCYLSDLVDDNQSLKALLIPSLQLD